jgi:two-component system, OmpR family, torCAD operon response regulator TorR
MASTSQRNEGRSDRAVTADPTPLHFEGFVLDVAGRTLVNADGHDVSLRRSEFELLLALVRKPGRALSRDYLLDAVSGRHAEAYDRSIDVLVGRLRRKIELEPIRPRLIITVPGIGYRFAAKPSPMPQQAAMGDPVPPSISSASVRPRSAE